MFHHNLKALFHPERYHGWGISKRFFEGWYYKIVNEKEDQAFAIIPGIAMDENKKKQAFIQILDGKNLTAEYIKFDAALFKAEHNRFEVHIDDNKFTLSTLELNLPNIKGKLKFHNQIPWPNSWYSPGIMGPFSFVPFMECYHGILSLDHSISGTLSYNDKSIDFAKGRGYMEKDWGHSFPEGYCWMQSNHFSKKGISIKSSVAKIPWMGSSFIGFIAGVWFHDRLIEFTTYNGSKLLKSIANSSEVIQVMENKRYRLELFSKREAATSLPSPIAGFMDGRIEESMTAEIEIKLTDKKNNRVLLQDKGRNACLEVAGKISEITVE